MPETVKSTLCPCVGFAHGPLYPADAWGHEGSWRRVPPKAVYHLAGSSRVFHFGQGCFCAVSFDATLFPNTDCFDCFLCTDELRSAYCVA